MTYAQKKRQSINVKSHNYPDIWIISKNCKAAIINIITMLFDINTLVMNGKIDILSRDIETIKKEWNEILELNMLSEILKITARVQ